MFAARCFALFERVHLLNRRQIAKAPRPPGFVRIRVAKAKRDARRTVDEPERLAPGRNEAHTLRPAGEEPMKLSPIFALLGVSRGGATDGPNLAECVTTLGGALARGW